MSSLESLGWNSFFEQQLSPDREADLTPARVVEEQRGSYRILGEGGPWYAQVSGRLRHDSAENGAALPCVGDWVLARVRAEEAPGATVIIHHVLSRRTKFSRRAPGERTAEQVVAANVDTVFLVQSLNRNFSPRRIERYLSLLWESGAEPVVVLHKADLCEDVAKSAALVEGVARGVAVHVTSAIRTGGLDPLLPYLNPGRTVALVGSSGVGKSTIVNQLAGRDLMAVQEIRVDDRGKHTTTARHLVALPGGGLLLDTPGMRTVLMWEGEEGVAQTFEDIEALAADCRFRDCGHGTEPGCRVREALTTGSLDPARYRSYTKLQREIRHEAMKSDVKLRLEEQRKWRRIHLDARRRPDKRKV